MGGRVAILQRRGPFNHEKMAPESFPGACQVTAHGKLEEGESFFQALYREIMEELGEKFLRDVYIPTSKITEVPEVPSTKGGVRTFAMLVDANCDILKIQLNPSSGGLVLATEEMMREAIPIDPSVHKKGGIKDLKTIAIFQDEIDTVLEAFKMLRD